MPKAKTKIYCIEVSLKPEYSAQSKVIVRKEVSVTDHSGRGFDSATFGAFVISTNASLREDILDIRWLEDTQAKAKHKRKKSSKVRK